MAHIGEELTLGAGRLLSNRTRLCKRLFTLVPLRDIPHCVRNFEDPARVVTLESRPRLQPANRTVLGNGTVFDGQGRIRLHRLDKFHAYRGTVFRGHNIKRRLADQFFRRVTQ